MNTCWFCHENGAVKRFGFVLIRVCTLHAKMVQVWATGVQP